MANINLNNFFANKSSVKSPVDSKILLSQEDVRDEYFRDLKLDLEVGELKNKSLNAKESSKDINLVVNEESVITSLRNIFKTYKGSRLLNPDISFDIKQYLFEPITQTKAWFLGYDICQQLPLYEPRVSISSVGVEGDPNQHCYVIDLKIEIPSLDKTVDIKSLLNEDGFYILG